MKAAVEATGNDTIVDVAEFNPEGSAGASAAGAAVGSLAGGAATGGDGWGKAVGTAGGRPDGHRPLRPQPYEFDWRYH